MRIVNSAGIAMNVRETGVPQVGQKAWIFSLPLFPATRQLLTSPVTLTLVRSGKVSQEPCPVPLQRWQSRNWQ